MVKITLQKGFSFGGFTANIVYMVIPTTLLFMEMLINPWNVAPKQG